MIELSAFLAAVAENAGRVHQYRSGGDGSDGTCDCIGEIIGAVRLCGEKWPWTHGSNYAARNRMRGLRYVSEAGELNLGELVYKAREPGEAGYSLPSAYAGSPDQRDYYHVGVVTGVSPLEITHCTKSDSVSGIVRDTKLGKWHWAGELNLVDYDGGSEDDVYPIFEAVVTAPSGKTVNMRKGPSKNEAVLEAVPIGTFVGVLGEYDNDWWRIEHNSKRGYMMSQFLSPIDAQPDDTPGIDDEDICVVSRGRLIAMKALLAPLINEATHLLNEVESVLKGGEC